MHGKKVGVVVIGRHFLYFNALNSISKYKVLKTSKFRDELQRI